MIYFLQQGATGPVKIGFARTRAAVARRISSFQTAHAEPLHLLAVIDGSIEDERTLHQEFARDRLRGEWFRPSPELLDSVSDERSARFTLDLAQSAKRWRRWGLVGPDGRLTDKGRMYLLETERFALHYNVDLEAYVTATFDVAA